MRGLSAPAPGPPPRPGVAHPPGEVASPQGAGAAPSQPRRRQTRRPGDSRKGAPGAGGRRHAGASPGPHLVRAAAGGRPSAPEPTADTPEEPLPGGATGLSTAAPARKHGLRPDSTRVRTTVTSHTAHTHAHPCTHPPSGPHGHWGAARFAAFPAGAPSSGSGSRGLCRSWARAVVSLPDPSL